MKRTFLFLLLSGWRPCRLLRKEGPPKVHARLVAEDKAIAPGGTITVALEEKIAPGWHTYWKNPGDAGAPTDIQWTLPPGWKAGGVQWPRPGACRSVGPLMDYGYEGTPWLLTTLTAPGDAKSSRDHQRPCKLAGVSADLRAGRCRAYLDLAGRSTNPGSGGGKGFWGGARKLLPVASPWKLTYALGSALDLYVAAPALAAAPSEDR